MDLTPVFLRYRECARHVWNTYFQPMPEGWHEFIDVERALFSGLVLSRFDRPNGSRETDREGHFEAIAVVPVLPPPGLAAMHASQQPGNSSVQWQEFTIDDASVDLRFIEFFDFANYQDPRDFKWVRVRVLGPAGHTLAGRDVLLEVPDVRFELRTVDDHE